MSRVAAAHEDGATLAMCADGVGLWTPWVAAGQVVAPGQALGELEVLGVRERVIAGGTRAGRVVAVAGARHHRLPVDFGAALVTLDLALGVAIDAAGPDAASATVGGGLRFVAPSSGRFYGRPGPGKPAFVTVGEVIAVGHTVCLLEVMKTFHRVTYGGAGLPDRAKVIAIAIADDADVNPGDVILHLEAVP